MTEETTVEKNVEKNQEEKSKKFASRKFIVWIVATVLELAFCAVAFVTSDISLAQEFIPWWGSISLVYIGGNVAQKFALKETK